MLVVQHESVRDAQDVVQPEEVQSLQTADEHGRDPVRDVALVLLRLPVELVRADGLELVELGVEDAQIDVVTQVYPNEDEECEEWPYNGVIEIVKDLGNLILD